MLPGQQNGNNAWNGRDDVSFEDSERFEEDSQVSLDESLDGSNQHWRGWSDCQSNCDAIQPGLSCVVYQNYNVSGRFSSASTRTVVPVDPSNPLSHHPMMSRGDCVSGTLLTLSEFSARVCAEKWSFQQLEEMYSHICQTRALKMKQPPPISTIPEKIFLAFIVHCFPQSTDEIRMYSTLANGSSEQYEFGKTLYEWGNVRDVSQTGFLLSGNVSNSAHPDTRPLQYTDQESYHVTVKVDRCRIVECTCECSNRSSWCKHVVALCIHRIFERSQIKFNETIADAINSMSDFDLRRLVQWHINEIPRKCIPGFQKLIDQIKDPNSMINKLHGAPDPTDGGHDPVSRYDFPEIESKIRRLLIRYCVPAPSVHCDIQYLTATHHPTHIEWTTIIKPLRCREPEGMWNLLQMIREMFARGDENAVALLRTVTDECLSNNQVLLWWYITKLVQSGHWAQTSCFKVPNSQMLAQLNCSQLCDEVVTLWKLVAINPRAGKIYRAQLATYLQDYHRTAVSRLKSMITLAPPIPAEVAPTTDATVLSNHQTGAILQTITNVDIRYPLSSQNMRFTLNCFPGFYPAIQMCHYLNEKDIRFGVPADAIFFVSAPNLANSYKMVPPHREKLLKKKKKKKKLLSKGLAEGEEKFSWRRDEYQGVDGVWRVLNEPAEDNAAHNDSTESGQESDVQKTPHRVEVSNRKKKMDAVEMDVNEVLAAAFTPLDGLDARFLLVEAYGTHGYRADAIQYALKVTEYLFDSLKEQSHDFRKVNEADIEPSTSMQSTSSASSTVSDEVTGADRDEEVTRGNKFLATMEKILYITKVLKDSQNLQQTVFDLSMRCLAIKKYPFFTKNHQIQFTYLETEFVAILDQIWQTVPMSAVQMETIRARALEIIKTNAGNNSELPPIAITKFLFLALYWTEPNTSTIRAAAQNPPPAASPALQHNRRLLMASDSDLALHVSLHVIGCRPTLSERYILHWETIRREKSELTSMLLVRYKDSQERCALVIDQILDPKLHRMYQHHLSNAAYFLERCPSYMKRFRPGQRPVFPYPDEPEQNPVVERARTQPAQDLEVGYKAQIEAELQRMIESDMVPRPAALISRERISDDGTPSSSSSDGSDYPNRSSGPSTSKSSDSIDSKAAGTSNPTKSRKNQYHASDYRKPRRRTVRSFSFDSGNLVTDAHVYHMNELSKKILFEAGGTTNNVIWGNHNVGGTNRRLHLCAIAIACYALGMSNRISPNWNTRTYNNISSWVTSQVQDIGPHAIELIREIWMAHFTPNEIAQISERAAPASDLSMKREAAKLSLSVLPFSHALTDEEVINALLKCREESRDMIITGLLAMDTPQFRQIGRSRPLFAAMHHWSELSFEEDGRQQLPHHSQQQQLQSAPGGLVPNPFAQMYPGPQLVLPQQQWQATQQPHHNKKPIRQMQVPIPPQAAFHLYPQVYEIVDQIAALPPSSYRHELTARLHQSHSAPQLGGTPGETGQEEHLAVPLPAANHQYMQPPQLGNALLNAYHYGMRAMDCMATSPGEERQMYLKFGQNAPYAEDLRILCYIAQRLGGQYLYCFYTNASRSVLSPYVLHQFATESVQYFPHRMYNSTLLPVNPPYPHLAPAMVPILGQIPSNIRYPNIRFSTPGQITSLFVAFGYQPITGELFERCCEQYLQAIINKMNSPRVNDNSEFTAQMLDFVRNAHDAFKWIPNHGRQLFDEFVRAFKRQKSFKKEFANSINILLNQLCGQ